MWFAVEGRNPDCRFIPFVLDQLSIDRSPSNACPASENALVSVVPSRLVFLFNSVSFLASEATSGYSVTGMENSNDGA